MISIRRLSIVSTVLFAAACSDSDGPAAPPPPANLPEVPPSFTLQVVHASSNAPAVNITANGSTVFPAVDYKESPIPLTLDPSGSYDITVDAILPGGDTATVLDLPGQTFEANTIYTVLAIGNVGDMGDTALQPKVVTRSRAVVPSDTVRATVLHAAAGAPPVDIYVTEPGADLSMVDPINGDTPVAFGDDALGPVDIDEGEYQIRIAVAGSKTAIAYDTGAITLDGGSDPIIAAVDNTFAGAGTVPGVGIDIPVSALVITRGGVAEIPDAQTTAELRVTHAVPDVGAPVDVWVDGDVAVAGFEFPNSVGPIALPGGDYVFQVAAGGNAVINPDGDATTLTDGVYYDAIAVGSVALDNLGLFTAADDRRRIATAAKLRVIHGSPSTPDVDLYIVDSTVTDITDVAPFAEDVPYLFNSAYLEVAPGTYNVYVTPADSKIVAIAAEGIALDAAGIYTAIARDADAGETGPGLILLDDF